MTNSASDVTRSRVPGKEYRIEIIGANYSYTFSRGMLAHALLQKGIKYEDAYNVAKKVQKNILSDFPKKKSIVINEDKLESYVEEIVAKKFDEATLSRIQLIDQWDHSSMPLIVLICGGAGTGTSALGKALSERFSINQIVSTGSIAHILRKIIAPELAPELHVKSYEAYEKLRPLQSVLYDEVIVGYEESSRFVASAVEALINRSIKEGISIIIRGEHLVPRYISKKILSNPNVVYFAVKINDSKLQLRRILAQSDMLEHDDIVLNFPSIRKISNYIIDQAEENNLPVIENSSDIEGTVDIMTDRILKRISNITSKD